MNKLSQHKPTPISTSFWVCLSCVLFWWFWSEQGSKPVQLYSYEASERAQWITSNDSTQHSVCLRKEIILPHDIKQSHLSIAHNGGFELIVNGNHVGAQTLWRPTRHFQNGLTDSGQRISRLTPIIVYNFPREYQWVGHSHDATVVHFDLTPYLRSGSNTICLEAFSRGARPSVIAFGSILLKDNSRIPFQTDTSWKGEPVPKDGQQTEWTLPEYLPKGWSHAIKSPLKLSRSFVSPVPPSLFSQYQTTHWNISTEDKSLDSFNYFTTFSLDDFTREAPAFLRVLTSGNHWIWINNKLLEGNLSKKSSYNGGEWDIKWEGRRPLSTLPILLDPDENSNFFGGDRYKTPSHGDPTQNDFRKFNQYLNQSNPAKAIRRSGAIEYTDDKEQTKNGGMSDPYGYYEEANITVPHTVLRPQLNSEYCAYDIKRLLRKGENTIRLRIINDYSKRSDIYGSSKATKFIVSGMASGVSLHALPWTQGSTQTTTLTGELLTPEDTPTLRFMGGAPPHTSHLIFLYISLCFWGCYLLQNVIAPLRTTAITFSFTLTLAIILQWSWMERSEYLFTHTQIWKYLCLVFASLMGLLQNVSKPKIQKRHLKNISRLIFVFFLLLVFFSRAWKVHLQPIDDDEFASIQAVLSIAETGVPQIGNDEIWYSRSPAYHYLAAIFVKVFGPNIWSLRLYSVVLSVCTGVMVWHMARVYLKNYWCANVSLLLFALHPFLIFSGHVARFYQQQQLFVLAMLHFFILGFLYQPTPKRRNLAIIFFSLAVLSQEISISFVPVFLILYLLLGKGVPWKWEFRSVLYIVLCIILIGTDIALFKVKCMTRSIGVSPNVEATLAPTFWELGNIFTMFIGYSRLHIILSCFCILSFFHSIRRGSSLLIILHISLLVSIVSFNFLITSVSFRYLYALIPVWLVLGTHGMFITTRWVSIHQRSARRKGKTIALTHWIALTFTVLSFSIWRISGSYDRKLLGDSSSSLAYVRKHLRPQDKVMITEPHPHAALIELGRVDYDLAVPILYDFTYQDVDSGGMIRDRNGNALVINRLAQIQRIFCEDERVWILLNREKFRSRKKNLRWEYPGAREELFIRKNCQLKFRSYLWHVYLWDRNVGKYSNFRKESSNWIE